MPEGQPGESNKRRSSKDQIETGICYAPSPI